MNQINGYPNIHPYFGERYRRTSGIKKLFLRALSLHGALSLKMELQLAFLRLSSWRVEARYRDLKGALVNIGSGRRGKPGWVNLDAFPAEGVNCLYDCRKKLPFPDDSCLGIFTEHFVEHLDYTEEIPYFLSECWRVLQTGGVLRVIVPDGGRYLQAYCSEGWEQIRELRTLDQTNFDRYTGSSYNTKMELINEVFRQADQHKFAYDAETLSLLLEKHGFRKIGQRDFGRSIMPELCLDLEDRAHESLYIEGIK